MNIFKRIERWFRRTILNPGKQSLAQEISANLTRIDETVNKAILDYAASVGGQPFAVFLSVAIANMGLSDAASRLLRGLLDRLGAGVSRSVGTRDAVADQAARFMESVRAEAAKA